MGTAGEKLRAELAAALAYEGELAGLSNAEFSELDQVHVEAAVMAADTVELLTRRIAAAEADPETSTGDLIKLIAERRQQSAKQVENVRWLRGSLSHAWGESVDPQRSHAGQQKRIGRPGRG